MSTDIQVSIGMRRLRIGELAPAITEADVRGLFVPYGAISSYVRPLNSGTGRPGETAFIEMADPGATRAVAGLRGRVLRNRSLVVTAQVDDSTRARPA